MDPALEEFCREYYRCFSDNICAAFYILFLCPVVERQNKAGYDNCGYSTDGVKAHDVKVFSVSAQHCNGTSRW